MILIPKKLVCTKSNENLFNFNTFKSSLKFASNIYNGKRIITKKDQYKMLKQLKDLEGYNPKNLDKINSRGDNVIEAFQNGVFPFKDEFQKNMSGMSDKTLPNWVNVGKKRFDRIKSQIQNAKKNNLQARP